MVIEYSPRKVEKGQGSLYNITWMYKILFNKVFFGYIAYILDALIVCFKKISRVGYMLSSEAAKVMSFRCFVEFMMAIFR